LFKIFPSLRGERNSTKQSYDTENRIASPYRARNDGSSRKEIHTMDDMEEMEERHSAIIECPHCHVKVLPMQNNICPSCRRDISDTRDTDPDQVSLTILESEDLPSFCYSCNLFTERTVRISGDGDSRLSLFPRNEVDTSNVIIFLPQCESCSDKGMPEPLDVDYEYQKMTFVVHKGFRDRVFEFREHSQE
jgi:hypothetical protein